MLFDKKEEIKHVKSCPFTKASSGVLEMPPELVAKVAGAVGDSIEWMVLLLGERSADGFHTKVTGFRVPKQRRSGGDVKMAEPMEGDGSTIGEDVIGVLHSHHRMGAFFSGTDNTELNPFFLSSIVVAQAKTALGFNYKAEGKVTLPCGSTGVVPLRLKVTGSERWSPVEVREYDGKAGFGDCDQVSVVEEVTETEHEVITVTKRVTPEACGLHSEETKKAERAFVFGTEGFTELMDEIRSQTVSYGYDQQERLFNGNGNQVGFGGHLSRKERKALRRQGKLSARNGGNGRASFNGSSNSTLCAHGRYVYCDECDPVHGEPIKGNGALCQHGILTSFDCPACEEDDRYVPGDTLDIPEHHKRCGVTLENSSGSQRCDMDTAARYARHDDRTLYMMIDNGDRFWLCSECYDLAEELSRDNEYETGGYTAELSASHPFSPGKVGKYCIAAPGGRTCLKERWDLVHVGEKKGLTEREARELAAAEDKASGYGSEFAERTRERLGVAGLLPPAVVH